MFYPEEKLGFEQIFGRVHVIPLGGPDSATYGENFMKNYRCESKQENNAILINPSRFGDFLESIKVMCEMDVDGEFKLTQRESANGIKKYLCCGGSGGSDGETFKYWFR